MPHLLLALLLQAAPPPLVEQFRADPPTHVLLIVELADGAPVRSEGAPGADDEPSSPGEAGRVLTALAGLESGALDADRRVRCDSLCWGRGSHGEPSLMEAIAFGCDSWAADAAQRVPDPQVAEAAVRAGFSRAPEAEGGWATTAREWTGFWRALSKGRLEVRPTTASTLLAAAGLSVASPRGIARGLHDPRHGVRAIAGASSHGAWVSGIFRKGAEVQWAFALFVPDGSVPLAVARAASLLDETLRRREHASSERGAPLGIPEDDR